MSNLVKYLLFFTNFLIFILGLAVFGLGIWVVVDKPSFLNLFEQAQDVAGEDVNINVELYSSAAYILMVVAFLVVLIAFFGCCGAIKENKCMLGTYFTLILAMFIVMVVGAVLGYSGNLEENIKNPLNKALAAYDDNPAPGSPKAAYKNAWNEVQKELKCCGVDSVNDWTSNGNFTWEPTDANKPEGCCTVFRSAEKVTPDDTLICRKSLEGPNSETYYFEGCYSKIKREIEDNQNKVVGVAIGVVVVMFLNMLFSFAMCTMVNK